LFVILKLGHWNLFGIWILVLGIFKFFIIPLYQHSRVTLNLLLVQGLHQETIFLIHRRPACKNRPCVSPAGSKEAIVADIILKRALVAAIAASISSTLRPPVAP